MRARILICLVLSVISLPAWAANPSPLTAAMDAYFNNPRSPGTFRALAGEGDPLFGQYPLSYSDGYLSNDQFAADVGLKDQFAENCRLDYARRTYAKRLSQLGRNHPYLRQWLVAQTAVFVNCATANRPPFRDLPPPLEIEDPDLRRLEQFDREYQHASALFYNGLTAQARAQFAAITRQSPHYDAAQFMLIAIDGGSQGNEFSSKPNLAELPNAEALLHDPKRKDMQAYAHEMIGWLGATADTREARAAQVRVTIEALELPLAVLRSDPQALARYRRANDDIGSLHGDFEDVDWWLRGGPPPGYFASAAMMRAAVHHHVAAWTLIPVPPPASPFAGLPVPKQPISSTEGRDFLKKLVDSKVDGVAWSTLSQELNPNYESEIWNELNAAIGRLRTNPNVQDAALVPRLLKHQVDSALGRWSSRESGKRDVINELAVYPYPESDHFGIIANIALRDLMVLGDVTAARELRDRVISRATDTTRINGTLVLLLAEDDDQIASAISKYQLESSPLLNLLPANRLGLLAANPRLSADDRARFARAAWTRLYALKRPIPRDLDVLMRSLNPKITSGWESHIGARRGDRTLLLDILRSPAMNILATSRTGNGWSGESTPETAIDVYLHSTNNWWCALDPVHADSAADTEIEQSFDSDVKRSDLEQMLHASALWMAFNPAEATALGKIDSAPKQLSEEAIEWAQRSSFFGRKRGEDESLALAIRTTRYGCQMQGGHGVYSRRAFELLHSKFPDSDAAKRTKYWFDCSHFTYGCDVLKTDQTSERSSDPVILPREKRGLAALEAVQE